MDFEDMDKKDIIHALDALNMIKILDKCPPCKFFSKYGCKYGFAPSYGYCHKFKQKSKGKS